MRLYNLLTYVAVLYAVALDAKSTHYWPLEIGNRWTYEYTWFGDDGKPVQQEVVVLEVEASEEVDGQTYFRLSNGQLLRNDENGNVVEYNNRFDSIAETEFVLFDFSDPEESFFQVPYLALPPTLGEEFPYPGASGRSTSTYETPAGRIDAYHFNFGDLGRKYAMIFGRGVGPLGSGIGSDRPGGENWNLIHAVVRGDTVISTAAQSQSWGMVKSLNERIIQ